MSYSPARGRAQWVGAAFVLTAAVGWLAAGYDLRDLRTAAAIADGSSLAPIARAARDDLARALAIAQLACAALVAALFVPWLYLVRANVRALGVRRLRFSREWTYVGFAIPGLNAFRPYQVVSEVWRASDPASIDALAWRQLPAPRLAIAWWVALVAWVALEPAAALLYYRADRLAVFQLAHALSLCADLCAAASASLGYLVVARISAAQEAKWHALGGSASAIRQRAEIAA